jgi:hypothetical protein
MVSDHAGRVGACDDAPARVAFRVVERVGPREGILLSRLYNWPARSPTDASPSSLANADARLGVDVDRYSFIVAVLRTACSAVAIQERSQQGQEKVATLFWQRRKQLVLRTPHSGCNSSEHLLAGIFER